MKQILVPAIVAAVVSIAVVALEDIFEIDDDDTITAPAAVEAAPQAATTLSQPSLRLTDVIVEDTWVNGSRTTGSDHRSLADASNSICYLTKVEIKGVQGPEDSNSCVIQIDEFLGFWELVATVEEGGQSEVRCNARCLTWE